MIKHFAYLTWSGVEGLQIGGFTLHYYSLMWIAGFIIGWYIMAKAFKTDNVSQKLLDPLFLYTFLGIVLGARLGEYLYYDPSAFIERPLEVFLPIQVSPGDSILGIIDGYKFVGFQGLASHGAATGALITTYLFWRKYLKGKKSIAWIFDRIALTIPIGGALIRIGNFINSEIVGKPSDLPWAVKFLNQSSGYGEIVPRHPAQLYEAICYLILFAIIWFIYAKTDKKKYGGYIFGLFFMCLWAIRFFVEFFKEDQGVEWVAEHIGLSLNNGQVLSIPLFLLGLIIFVTSKNRIQKKS